MRKLTFAAAIAAALAASAPAVAQSFFGNINGTPFSGYTTPDPSASFWNSYNAATQGFYNAGQLALARRQAMAAEAAAEANSPYGQCVTRYAYATMRQKKLPSADVVRAKMDQVRAYCWRAFAGVQ
jgi:hypothetical protein